MQLLGEGWEESAHVPDVSGLIVCYQWGDVEKRHRKLGSVVESWESLGRIPQSLVLPNQSSQVMLQC